MFSGALMLTPSILHVSVIVLRKKVTLLAATSMLVSSRNVVIRINMFFRRYGQWGVIGGTQNSRHPKGIKGVATQP